MKPLFTIFAAVMIAGCADGQKLKEAEVPAPVVSAFQKLYSNISDVNWTIENGDYEAQYEVDKIENSASFDINGNLIQTEKAIDVSGLPTGVTTYVSQNYSGAKIKEAAEITDTKGVKTYEAEVKGTDLLFDAKGTYLKSEKD